MKITTFATSIYDLNQIKNQDLSEVILGHRDFSRFGKLTGPEFIKLAEASRELGLKVIFEWDILMTENTFVDVSKNLSPYLPLIDSLRVQDPGAFYWGIKNTSLPMQFIAENGNHNLEALLGWKEFAQGRLERMILSIELSKDVIKEFVSKLGVPCELLGFGRILLFYTPRSLLKPLQEDKLTTNEELSVLGSSEESPHKGFPVLENKHGTFMFHIKEFSLIEFASELKDMGLDFFRVDTRFESSTLLSTLVSLVTNFHQEAFASFKESYPQDLMRGFYLVNKTDVLFPKLKNARLQKREGDYVGEVLEAEKGSHLAIMIKNPKGLKITDKLKILHPKGEVFEIKIHSLRNLSLEEVVEVKGNTLALIPYVGGVWVKSQVFYNGQD